MSNREFSRKTVLDLSVQERFLRLPCHGKCQAEYVWIGGNNELRCKTMTLDKKPDTISDLAVWNFDGSSTGQAPGKDSEVLLKPCAMFLDPFRGAPHVLVMCACYLPDPDKPQGLGGVAKNNSRQGAEAMFQHVKESEPWFGIEQEYTLFEVHACVCVFSAVINL